MLILTLLSGTRGVPRYHIRHACEIVPAGISMRPGFVRTLCGRYYKSRLAQQPGAVPVADQVNCANCKRSVEKRLRRAVVEEM